MAASLTPRQTAADPPNPAAAALAAWPAVPPLAVAYSGGADSTALLHACAARWPARVHALHVHHGLQAAADGFARHCQDVCTGLGVPLHIARVDARHGAGESPEDAARRARYTALAAAARACHVNQVLLAQHADDQVETLLLALSRGAGLPGLSAMPASFERHGMLFGRPLLQVSGPSLRQWLADTAAPYIEDPTNADTAFTRNRIRHDLIPALASAFPQWRETFARSARHAAQAQAVLDEVAAADLLAAGDPPALAALQALGRGRRANLLRHWLRTAHATAATAAQMEELLGQVEACTTRGHRIRIKTGTGFAERAGDRLVWVGPV